jgi:hypothetical protein
MRLRLYTKENDKAPCGSGYATLYIFKRRPSFVHNFLKFLKNPYTWKPECRRELFERLLVFIFLW